MRTEEVPACGPWRPKPHWALAGVAAHPSSPATTTSNTFRLGFLGKRISSVEATRFSKVSRNSVTGFVGREQESCHVEIPDFFDSELGRCSHFATVCPRLLTLQPT